MCLWMEKIFRKKKFWEISHFKNNFSMGNYISSSLQAMRSFFATSAVCEKVIADDRIQALDVVRWQEYNGGVKRHKKDWREPI